MASTSPWASLYFVALMTFGNYVLFNLLVAILVEGFQAEVRGTEVSTAAEAATAFCSVPSLQGCSGTSGTLSSNPTTFHPSSFQEPLSSLLPFSGSLHDAQALAEGVKL